MADPITIGIGSQSPITIGLNEADPIVVTTGGASTSAFSDADSVTVYALGVPQKHIIRRDLANLGAVEGTSDANIPENNAAHAAAIATGLPHTVKPGSLYKFGVGKIWPSGAGFEVPGGGWATFLMATGAGYFDCSKNIANVDGPGFINYTSTARTLIQNADEAADLVIDGVEIQLEANAGIRTAGAIHFYHARNMQCARVRVVGFKENLGGVIRLRSCSDGFIHVWAEDLVMNSTSLTYMQVTALEIDDAIGSEAVTQRMEWVVHLKNFCFGSTARAHYGEQTDGLNIQSKPATDARNRYLVMQHGTEGAGDIVDSWGSGNVGRIVSDDARNFVLKMPYSGHRNHVKISGDGSGLAGLYIAASTVTDRDVPPTGNLIEGKVINVGRRYSEYHQGAGHSMQAGVQQEGSLQTASKSSGNLIRMQVEGYSTVMPYAVAHASAGPDSYEVQSSSFQTAFAYQHLGDGLSKRADIRRIGTVPLLIRAHYGTAGPTTFNPNDPLPFDSVDIDNGGHYDSSTKLITFPLTGVYPFSGVVNVTSLGAGGKLSIVLTHNSVQTYLAEFENKAATATAFHFNFSGHRENTQPGSTGKLIIGLTGVSTVNIGGSAASPYATYLYVGAPQQFYRES